jgi:hypothetical protein
MPITPYYESDVDGNITSPVGLPTPSEVRTRWCYGLPLTNELGIPMDDEDLLAFLEGAIATVERRLGIFLKPMKIVSDGERRGLVEGTDFDREEPPYDYDAKAWVSNGFLQLKERPLISLNEFKLVLPNNQVIMDFMERPEWVKLNKSAGQLRIVPYAGDPSLFNMAGGTLAGYPFIAGAMSGSIPQMLYVSYTAGYGVDKLPKDIRNAVAKYATIDVLGIAGDAVLAGVASLSTAIDGLSESFSTTASATNATYGAHILQYQKEVDALFDDKKGGGLRTSERGITMTGL